MRAIPLAMSAPVTCPPTADAGDINPYIQTS
jgi:hypothetical protein